MPITFLLREDIASGHPKFKADSSTSISIYVNVIIQNLLHGGSLPIIWQKLLYGELLVVMKSATKEVKRELWYQAHCCKFGLQFVGPYKICELIENLVQLIENLVQLSQCTGCLINQLPSSVVDDYF